MFWIKKVSISGSCVKKTFVESFPEQIKIVLCAAGPKQVTWYRAKERLPIANRGV